MRIGVSSLTGKIYQGRVNNDGSSFIGQKRDITGDFMRALIEKAMFEKGEFFIHGSDGSIHKVTVTKEK